MKIDQRVGITQLATLVGVSDNRIRQLCNSGDLERGEDGQFDLRKSVRAYCATLRDHTMGRGGPGLAAEREREARARADKLEMQNAAASRKLIPADEVEAMWDKICRLIRARFLAMPARLQQNLAHLSAYDLAVMDREIRDALTELADDDLYLPFAMERLRSYRDHESFYRLRLKSAWGNSRIDEITPHDVVELQDRLRTEGLSNATTNRYTAFVRRVFNLAIRWQILSGRNPAQHAEMRREQHRDTFLSQDQLKVLFRSLDEEPNKVAAGLIAFLAATGARRGEAMTARWEHIDLERRLWTVPVSKSGRRRHIPLSNGALLVLQRLPSEPRSPWVFPGAKGKPIGCLRKAWTRIKARAGIPVEMRIHDLRHTFASMIVGRGRSLQEVGALPCWKPPQERSTLPSGFVAESSRALR